MIYQGFAGSSMALTGHKALAQGKGAQAGRSFHKPASKPRSRGHIVCASPAEVLETGPELSTRIVGSAPVLRVLPTPDTSSNIVPFCTEGSGLPASDKLKAYLSQHATRRLRTLHAPIDRYLYLRDIQLYNPGLYFQLLMEHTEEVMPYVYTPTVGEACQRYHTLPIPTQGVYISMRDKGRVLRKLQAATSRAVKVMVVTDGERILGLGDLGANGMGISEGKIQLYTAIGGVHPDHCLPVCLDVGTDNTALLADPQYRGLRQRRARGADYDELVDELMAAVRAWQPHMLLQFEDFGNTNAFRLLDRYRERQCCFNDDIQGTACIALAGIMAALRASGRPLSQQRVLFLGAGEAGTGIGDLFAKMVNKQHGTPLAEARKQCFFMDSQGLICKSRTGLQHHKQPFAHDVPFHSDLLSAVHALQPTVLVGVSTMAGAFNEQVVRAMSALNTRPVIMPLSNPTSKAECTYEQAFTWSEGRVVFASGSPFLPITTADGRTHHPAQANNAYIFPAVGHAAVLTSAQRLPDSVFLVAAEELAKMSPTEQIEKGYLFPPFTEIASVSRKLIAKVGEHIVAQGLGRRPQHCADWECFADSAMWEVGGDVSIDRECAMTTWT